MCHPHHARRTAIWLFRFAVRIRDQWHTRLHEQWWLLFRSWSYAGINAALYLLVQISGRTALSCRPHRILHFTTGLGEYRHLLAA